MVHALREEALAPATTADLLRRTCVLAARECGVAGAVITLVPSSSTHAVIAASDPDARGAELVELDVGEGPSRSAYALGRPVLVPSLADAAGRWPGFVDRVAEVGIRAAFAFPIRVGASRLGVLTLHHDATGDLAAPALQRALILADLAVEVLLDDGDGVPERELEATLSGDRLVYQAQGMLMVRLGVTLADALARMRAHAYASGLTLVELAARIVDGSITLERPDGEEGVQP
jgi:GAF domain-containing protein